MLISFMRNGHEVQSIESHSDSDLDEPDYDFAIFKLTNDTDTPICPIMQ